MHAMHTSAYQCTPLPKRALTVLLDIDTDLDIRVVVKIVARDAYLADKTIQVIARGTPEVINAGE